MESRRHSQLNPLAFAVAAGCTELIIVLIIGFPMIGMTGMAGVGHMMWGYGVTWWLGGALLIAFAGALFALVYNAINASWAQAASQEGSSGPIAGSK